MPSLSEIMTAMPTATQGWQQQEEAAMRQAMNQANLEGKQIANQQGLADLENFMAGQEMRNAGYQAKLLQNQFESTPEFRQAAEKAQTMDLRAQGMENEATVIRGYTDRLNAMFDSMEQGDMQSFTANMQQLSQDPGFMELLQGNPEMAQLAQGAMNGDPQAIAGIRSQVKLWDIMASAPEERAFKAAEREKIMQVNENLRQRESEAALQREQARLENTLAMERDAAKAAQKEQEPKKVAKVTPVYIGEKKQEEKVNALMKSGGVAAFWGGLGESDRTNFKSDVMSYAKTMVRMAANQGVEMDHALAIDKAFAKMSEGFTEGTLSGEYTRPDTSGGVAPAAPTGLVNVTTAEEYNALPSGTEYVGPDGKKRRKK